MDYRHIIYDQLNNKSFCNKLKVIQCNASLAITWPLIGTLKTKLCKVIGFKSFMHSCIGDNSDGYFVFTKLRHWPAFQSPSFVTNRNPFKLYL